MKPFSFRHLKPENYIEQPWKNGQGLTREIAISPPTSRFPADSFDWRLSSATIRAANSFSQFPGYDRLLVVWQGDGVILNGEVLPALTAKRFAGEEKTECSLVAGPVEDLGLIFNRATTEARVQIRQRPGSDLFHSTADSIIFCANGELILNQSRVLPGEVIVSSGSGKVEFNSSADAVVIHFEIWAKGLHVNL